MKWFENSQHFTYFVRRIFRNSQSSLEFSEFSNAIRWYKRRNWQLIMKNRMNQHGFEWNWLEIRKMRLRKTKIVRQWIKQPEFSNWMNVFDLAGVGKCPSFCRFFERVETISPVLPSLKSTIGLLNLESFEWPYIGYEFEYLDVSLNNCLLWRNIFWTWL